MKQYKHTLLFITLLTSFGLMSSGHAGTKQSHPESSGKPHLQEAVKKTQPIKINSADVKALHHKVKGIGEVRAKAIVAYRDAHGRYKTIDDLSRVPGISKRVLARYRDIWQKSFTME